MKVSKEVLSKTQVKLTIELDQKSFDSHKAHTLEHLREEVEVPGFRKGHAPEAMIIQKIGEQAFEMEVMDHAISHAYSDALHQEKLQPVDYPKIEVTGTDPLSFTALVDLMPELSWKKDLKSLKLKANAVEVGDLDVEEVLQNLLKNSALWIKKDAKAEDGDRVEIDFDGFDEEGVALEGTSSKNHPLILGSNSFIPGFEEALVGASEGDEKSFEVVFPADYGKEDFQNKKVRFEVKVHQVERQELPELNDEFVQSITGGARANVAELKEEIQTELKAQRERNEMIRLEEEFITELLPYIDFEVSDAMVERELSWMREAMKKEAPSDEDGEKEEKKQAREMIQIRMALETLYKERAVEVKTDEVMQELSFMMSRYPQEFKAMLLERYKPGSQEWRQVENQLKVRKVMQSFL